MATKTTTARKKTSKTRRASRYTPEQIAAAKARDAALTAAADAALADPAKVAAIVAAAPTLTARVARYSLRNQMLLAEQTAERGMPLADVATSRAWRNVGRAVRAEEYDRPLWICRPAGERKEDGADQADGDAAAGETPESGEEEGTRRPLFRMFKVYEISQTDGIEGFTPAARRDAFTGACGGCNAPDNEPCYNTCRCEGCEELDPEELLTDSLTEQIRRAGYTLTPAGVVSVDHDQRTAAAPTAAPELAQVMAAIEVARTQRRTAKIPTQRTADQVDNTPSVC